MFGRHRVAIRATAIAFMLATTVVACGDDDAAEPAADGDAAPTSTVAGSAGQSDSTETCTEERRGGEVSMGMFVESVGLDPVVASGNGVAGATEMAAIYDTLMRYNPGSGEYEPRVAESLESNDDFTQWTLTLRDGVTFGNGDPLNAQAVITSIERHRAPESRSRSKSLASTIATMTAVDELTVQFDLTGAWSAFPYLLADEPGMITNQKVIDALGADEFNRNPLGAGVGAFEPVSFTPNDSIVMKAKTDWWGGPVCLDQLRFVRLSGAQLTYESLKNDELQVGFLREPVVIAQAREDGVEHFVGLQNGGGALVINNGVRGAAAPTSDERLRLAVAYALDPAVLDERANSGEGLPTSAVISEKSLLYDGNEGPEYDPDEARRLVEEVKAEGQWDGTIRLACQNSPTASARAQAIEAMLETVGFNVEVNLSATVIADVTVNANYDLACWGLNINDASTWSSFDQYRSDSARNITGYADPRMDAALAELRAAPDVDAQKQILGEIQQIWNETAPSYVYETIEEVIVWRPEVKGLEFNLETVVYFDGAYVER